jgi:O-antigen ligase
MSNKNSLLTLGIGVLIELVFHFAVVLGSQMLFLLGIVFLLASLFVLPKDNLILLLLFLIPAQRNVVYQEGGTTLLNIFIPLLLVYQLRDSRVWNNSSLIVVTALLVCLSLGLALVHENLLTLILLLKFVLTSWVLYIELKGYSEKLELIRSYFIGVAFFLFLSLLTSFESSLTRFSGGEYNEPNYVGTIASYCLAIGILLRGKKLGVKGYYFICAIFILLAAGFFTQSRSFLLSLALVVLFGVIVEFKRRPFMISIVLVVFVNMAGVLYLKLSENVLFNSISSRVLDPKGGDVSGGRLDLWGYYLNRLVENEYDLLFGVGNDAMNLFGFEQVAHNFFIEDLVTTGAVGVLFIYTFLYFIAKDFYNLGGGIGKFLPLFLLLLNSFTLHSFLGIGGLIPLFIGFVILGLKDENISNSRV